MKKPIYLVLSIIILTFVIIFTIQNTTQLDINILFWKITTSQVVLIFSMFSFGILLAITLLIPTIIKYKSEIRTLKKSNKLVEKKANLITNDDKTNNA